MLYILYIIYIYIYYIYIVHVWILELLTYNWQWYILFSVSMTGHHCPPALCLHTVFEIIWAWTVWISSNMFHGFWWFSDVPRMFQAQQKLKLTSEQLSDAQCLLSFIPACGDGGFVQSYEACTRLHRHTYLYRIHIRYCIQNDQTCCSGIVARFVAALYLQIVFHDLVQNATKIITKLVFLQTTTLIQNWGADAIYCFVSGHCNNTEVTETTTQTEASAVCDKLYGQRQGQHAHKASPPESRMKLTSIHQWCFGVFDFA